MNRWFVVPVETYSVSGAGIIQQAKYADRLDGYSGTIVSGNFVARFYADDATLDDIAAQDDAVQVSGSEAQSRIADKLGYDLDVDTSFFIQ